VIGSICLELVEVICIVLAYMGRVGFMTFLVMDGG
jgi:hypothetical protein